MSIMELMDFGAAYKGNFLSSILTLCDSTREDVILVFPKRAETRDYIPELLESGRIVYFLPDGIFQRAALLRKLIWKHRIRLVHSHFIDSKTYIPLRMATFGHRCVHIFHAHSLPKFPKKGWKTSVRRSLMHTDRVLCVSDAVRKGYAERGFQNLVTIPNGIDLERLTVHEDFPKRSPSVLMFGYDFSIKGIDTALKAFRDFDPEHRFTLRICVANHMDSATDYIRKMFGEIPDFVELLPPRSDVGTYFSASDIFLSASRTEGMPYAVLEAAASSLPIALSRIEPHTELCLPQVEFFDTENPKDLFDAVQRAVQCPPSDENAKYIKQNFSMQAWTERVFESFPS